MQFRKCFKFALLWAQVWRSVGGIVVPVPVDVSFDFVDQNDFFPYDFVLANVMTDNVLTVQISGTAANIMSSFAYSVQAAYPQPRE